MGNHTIVYPSAYLDVDEVDLNKVCVLISTYNGSRYICEQLDSILSQESVEVELFIRDDGSNDGTPDLIQEYCRAKSNVHFRRGENLGYEKSYYSLLSSDSDSDYFAFADQDDVWDLNKLAVALKQLKEVEVTSPAVYWCNLMMVDKDLRKKGPMHLPDKHAFSKGRYLIDKYGYGCTMVFNRSLRDLALRHEPTTRISHDNWIGLLGVFFWHLYF